MLVVEYLVILPKGDTFCDSVKAFTRLMGVDSSIVINAGKIKYKGDLECDFAITTGDISDKPQRFFHLRFAHDAKTQIDIDLFSSFLKTVRSIMNKAGGQPETLWDDVS